MKRAPAKNSSAWGLPVQAKNFPQEIILLPRWTGWAASPRPGQINKWDKKPVVSIGGSIQGLRWTDPAQWRTFDEVYAEYVANEQISGVGFILNQISEGVFGDDLIVFDLDNAVIDGEINPVARQVMEQFPTYWELSPSGTGLRGIIRGNIEVEVTTSRCEVYDGRSNRFVTITGHQIPGTCNAVQWAEPDALYDFIQSHRSGTASASRSRANKPMPELLPEEKASALIEELRKSCNADLIKYVDGGETVGRYDNAGSLSEVVAGFIATAYTAGFSDQQVLSMLWFHEHTQVYYKPDRANRLAFFWSECCACHFDRTATAEDFKVVATEAKSTSSVSINAKQSLLEALIPGGEFAKQLIEIDFVIEEIIQRGYIYALTGLSNAGKTAVALAMSVSIALEQPFAGHYTTKGRVLFLAGENPQNVQMRLRAMLEQNELDETVLDKILIRQNVFSLRRNMDDIRETLKELDDIVLIVIDSKLVFFEGDSEDDNKQAAEQVADLQKLTQMHGNPSLLVLCHPIKAARDQKSLEPRGGGAFLNQIDANLTVWKADEGLTQLSWAKKIRGAGFAPINIKITEVPLKDCVMKQSGKPITTVIAEPIEPSEVRELVKDNRSIEDNVLLAMFENSGISIREIARRLNWSEGQKGKIERALQALKKDKLVTKHRRNDPYELSAMGKKEAQALIERGVELPPLKF